MAVAKVWDGSAWVPAKWRDYDGSAWVERSKVWDGSAWVPIGEPEITQPTVVATEYHAHTSTSDVRVSVGSSYTPVLGDLIVTFANAATEASVIPDPPGWTNPLGAEVELVSPGNNHTLACMWHFITAADVTAGAYDWLLSPFWTFAKDTRVYTAAIRGAATPPIDTINTATGAATTIHAIPGLTTPAAGALILAGVVSDGDGNYGAAPSGWTTALSDNRGTIVTRDAPADGSNIPATSVTRTSDEFASITMAIAGLPA